MSEAELEAYLKEIRKIPLLTPEQEREYSMRVKKGDQLARDEMIRANLRLVVSIAKEYRKRARGMSFLDLIAEGNLGLLRAVERFNPDHIPSAKHRLLYKSAGERQGMRFSTYATWWIRQAVRRAIINSAKTIRIPSYMVEIITKWKNAAADLRNRYGRQPTVNEISNSLRIPARNINIIKRMMRASNAPQAISMELLPTLGGGLEDLATKVPEESVFSQEESDKIKELLSAIDEREALILRLRYGLEGKLPRTLREIGDIIALTRERVRQIENDALRKLQKRWLQMRKGSGKGTRSIPRTPFEIDLRGDGKSQPAVKIRAIIKDAIDDAIARKRIEARFLHGSEDADLAQNVLICLEEHKKRGVITYIEPPQTSGEGADVTIAYLRREDDEEWSLRFGKRGRAKKHV